jgi:hypothetical protein
LLVQLSLQLLLTLWVFCALMQEAKFFVGSTVVACSVLLYNDELVTRDRRGNVSSSANTDLPAKPGEQC